ncbi:hypothetical protein GC169_07575 [bacterium]|nr:hypothetical protein [bacterium]
MTLRRPAAFAAAIFAIVLSSGCALTAEPQTPPHTPAQLSTGAVAPAIASGPVRNLAAQPGEEVVTLRYWKIRKGTFDQFLAASQNGVWPYFEKIGSRVVGMWKIIPTPGSPEASADYDEVYLMTRYASVEHWAATRRAEELGGDGPDADALRDALAVRQNLSLETRLTFLQGFTGPNGPYFMPGTGERFEKVE